MCRSPWVSAFTAATRPFVSLAHGSLRSAACPTVRNFDGSTTDTVVGDADFGSIDQTNRKITVRVSTTRLNAILTAAGRPRIVSGSILCGLRGRTFELDPLALEDFTRGGTEFKVK